uniref:ANK_REP_REGION domain-containing protein n=1 Tax=Macrostomum lignano TaxID=282301 RepID=A0A1I8HWJ3_9PLAT
MSNVNSCEESDASSYSDASVDSDSEEPKQTSKQQNMKEELDVSLDAGQQRKQIFHAIRTGQAEKFSQLTTKYGSVCLDYLDEATGLSCLNLAVQCGRARIVSAILNSYGSKGSERRNKAANATCKGLTPLHLAANFCHSRALISLLAGAEIDWNIRDDRGQTAVHIACNRNDDNIIKLLLAYDWNNKATKKGCKCCNPVSICVSAKVNEKLEKQPWKNMQILRESAAPVNEGQKTLFWKNIPPSQNANKLLTSKDSHDVTPLMLAASAKGSLLKHLREKLEEEALKKAIKMKDHDGNTMLHYAVVSNEAEKIELLVGRGADINAENSDKSTPLLVASTLGHTKSVIKLLELGASKYTKDKQGRTAMHWCFRQQDTNIYDALMKEASEEENDAEFMTPFHWACRQARQEEAMLMVKKNSKLLGKVDAQLRTGLHWAVLANSTDLVKALLQLKTEPNQPATVLSKCLNAGDFQG